MDGRTLPTTLTMQVLLWIAGTASPVLADLAMLKNGMEIQGDFGETSSLGTAALSPLGVASSSDVKLIQFVDDGLRRTFFSRYQLQSRRPDVEQLEVIRVDQQVTTAGKRIGLMGTSQMTPLDEFGRCTLTLLSADGPVRVILGVTEITPVFVRLQGLQTSMAYELDMRVATSSLSREQLMSVVKKALDADRPDERLKLVRLLLQAEMYQEAEASLREAIDALPELADQKEQLIELQRVRVRQAVEEIRLRFGAGQYRLAAAMMQSMPAAELPAEAMVELQVVNEEFEKRSAQIAEGTNLLRRLRETLTDDPMRKELEALFDQMQQELNPHTISRCAELLRSADNQAVSDEQRVALAISGWLTGEHASDSPSMARSLLRTRDAVREYLTTDSATRRAAIVEQLQSEEAGDPRHVSQILAAMAPPREHPPAKPFLAAPADADAEESERPPEPIPNLFEIELKGVSADQSIRYLVQLPPEYDPLRRYPAIVGLHPGGMPPLSQIEWWSGPYDQKLGMRLGQAARHGYIVIAPAWNRPKTVHYEYSAMEHAAVLFSLRDACHRFGVDTDRVFLCGHSTGGDAAWDIGLAHPDVWAGVILFGATSHQPAKSSPRYVTHYWPNAKMVPLYFVGGDKDSSRMEMNAQDFNAYLRKSGFDVMVVEYRGRGHESFSDEIQRLFRWMKIHRRDFHPKEIDVVTRRPCDNFFWFLETQGMNPRSMIGPFEWPQPRAALPFAVKASVREKSRVHLTTNAAEVTVYLAPEMVDFEGDVSILLRNRKRAKGIRPNLRVLLEDVRTRGDRLHPFWAKEVIQQ